MQLYHFTSTYHFPEIYEKGIFRGEVPLPTGINKGINGVWLTSNNNSSKQLWVAGGSNDKTKIRITLSMDNDDPYLFKWDKLSSLLKFQKADLVDFNSYGDGAKYWYVYLGKITIDKFLAVKINQEGKWETMNTENLINEYDYKYIERHSLHYDIEPFPVVIQNVINDRIANRG